METPTVTNRAVAPHYQWGAICDGWRLLDMQQLCVIEERMPPNSREMLHFHRTAVQVFYVLDGHLTIELDGRENRLARGDTLTVLPPTPHEVRNDGDCDARFLVISSPSAGTDREVP
jgi:quercetin dioxygenase-like cupin family protein